LALKRKDSLIEQIKDEIRKEPEPVKPSKFLSTGSTLLNLAMTDNPFGGWVLGSFNSLVGDSDSGKTLMLLQAFAEANANTFFDTYDIYHDEPESKCSFNLAQFNLQDRLNYSIRSATVQDWVANCWRMAGVTPIKEKKDKKEKESLEEKEEKKDKVKRKSFIYGVDSFDAVGSDEERERFDLMVKQQNAGKTVETQGSYQTEKPKQAKSLIREIKPFIKESESLMIAISQTIDKIGPGYGGKTRAGGHWLKFNSTHEIWLRVVEYLKKKERIIGVRVGAQIKKNHHNGKLRTVEFDLYGNYGVDDIGSMIDFMIQEKFWKKGIEKHPNIIDTGDDFPREFTWDSLRKHIEENSLEDKLKVIVGECWNQIEEEINPKFKAKY